MEFFRQEARNEMALATIAVSDLQPPAYQETTVPINGNKDITVNGCNKNNNNNNNNKIADIKSQQDNNVNRNLSNLLPREPVDIQFEDIAYSVKTGLFKEKTEILHKVNGHFPGNQLIAIMGPSGAGKSTLLDVLSGYRKTNVTGLVYLNGRVRNLDMFRKMTCYITQDDRLQPLLNVRENMVIAADLKLGTDISKQQKNARIDDILHLLGLDEHEMTLAKRLSGGQKKRLSIALELVNNPTIMFLDEPTTGLDSYSCKQVVELLKKLAQQGRTIICTIHQPSAKIFEEFDQVYVLSGGNCLYQGCTNKIVPYLQSIDLPCPLYHNPADYIIELACGDEATNSERNNIEKMVEKMQNGKCLDWFTNRDVFLSLDELCKKYPLGNIKNDNHLEATSMFNQFIVLSRRNIIKAKRDHTLTSLRVIVNIIVAVMLGLLFIKAGNEGSRVLDNYNLLFAILMHHMMTTMMLTVLTFPTEMSILTKEHFNRWYTLKAYYASITIVDLPISIVCCFLFSVIIYLLSSQPMELFRFGMFFTISLLVILVAQGVGLMIGAMFSVVNGVFLAPTLSVPTMMFAGFGVTLRDLPTHLKWGSYVSYLRYGLEGYVGAIYGSERAVLECEEQTYCHYRYPNKFLSEISMEGDQFWNDVFALTLSFFIIRILAFLLLKWKIMAVR